MAGNLPSIYLGHEERDIVRTAKSSRLDARHVILQQIHVLAAHKDLL